MSKELDPQLKEGEKLIPGIGIFLGKWFLNYN
jgi:hypothetical protein